MSELSPQAEAKDMELVSTMQPIVARFLVDATAPFW